MGIVSAGYADGANSAERKKISELLFKTSRETNADWFESRQTPFALGVQDGTKQTKIPGIINWYKKNKGINILDKNVYFFDDRKNNINGFEGTNYNAKQISCGSRDSQLGGSVGLCGAKESEIIRKQGINYC